MSEPVAWRVADGANGWHLFEKLADEQLNSGTEPESLYSTDAIESRDAAIAELVQQLKDERDAWEDLRGNSVSIDGWLRRFAARRIGAINKVIDK